jgi:basic membrane protein A and related proteins
MTDIACCGEAVPAAIAAKVKAEREAIIKGEKKVFMGPLSDQGGKEQVPAGKDIADSGLWTMKWYVPGVVTSNYSVDESDRKFRSLSSSLAVRLKT